MAGLFVAITAAAALVATLVLLVKLVQEVSLLVGAGKFKGRDEVSRGVARAIRAAAEQTLGRSLTSQELRSIEIPRSYVPLEMILDHLEAGDLSPREVERYLQDLAPPMHDSR